MAIKLQYITFAHMTQTADHIAKVIRTIGKELQSKRNDLSFPETHEKSANQLVTLYDIETEKKLIEELQKLIPEAGFITEEAQIAQNSEKEYVWIIDPIDGTTNFVHGLPVYSISVALMFKCVLTTGVVYELNRDELFVAEKGRGAFMNNKPIRVSRTSDLEKSLIATGFPYYDYERIDPYLNSLKHFMRTTRGVRRLGSAAVDLAYVAAGRFDAFYEYSLSPWDVAAGILLVQEAGGIISGFKPETDPIFGKEIIASTPLLMHHMQHILNEYGL